MKLTPRDFRGNEDIPRVKEFLKGRQEWDTLPDYWNMGRSPLGTFVTMFEGDSSHHRLWQDDDGIIHAYLWLCPEPVFRVSNESKSWRMLIHPDRRSAELATEVIAFAENHLTDMSKSQPTNAPFKTVAYENDHWLVSLLESQGYTRDEFQGVYMRRPLSQKIPVPDIAEGYIIRGFDPKNELVQRAGVQSDAFGGMPAPDEWSIENIRRYILWYEGRQDLDLVAVSLSGEVASFAAFLVDPVTLLGELDPVGTRQTHQRKGLSRAVLLSGLRYLKDKGMRYAIVRTSADNLPAIRLYESVGFDIVDRLYRYIKKA